MLKFFMLFDNKTQIIVEGLNWNESRMRGKDDVDGIARI